MSDIVRIQSIGMVHQFLGLPKPDHPLVSVIPVDDRIINYDYENARYVFDFYQINFKEGFSGHLQYGRNSYDFEEGTLVFIRPGQSFKVESREEVKGGSGWTLLFHPDLIRKSNLGQEIEQYSFFDYEQHEALHLSDREKNAITDLIKKIQSEYQQNLDKYSQELIIANIELLLKYCKRFYDRQFYTRTNLNKDVLTQFDQIIRAYYSSEKPQLEGVLTVKACAEALNLSVNYLGDLIRAETGRKAKDHIQDYVVEKAKTKLLGSNLPISQIAYSLGFEYP
ncbi:MAG: helix-turn-helix domain-containing protein, partial [Bacteroidota bacterium]